ncbi:NUDIX domain-containing protein [Actinomadura luteofluorescens]|uniref:NUDIX domain-containing protein n=1 Tax=Actinomadura luteofluorescens TaxID=46163 RepID=UPI00346F0BC4
MREYTDPIVLTTGVREGWADPETDPTRIVWAARQPALIPFEVVNGRPVNPREKTPIQRGRNQLGGWAENLTADALASALDEFGNRWIVLVERNRGRGWGLPGGFQDPGETSVVAACRELREEASLDLRNKTWRSMPPRYVPSKRSSDEAWIVTVPCTVDLGILNRHDFPRLIARDDAIKAAWVRANTLHELTAYLKDVHGGEVTSENHVGMLTDWFAAA